MSDIFCFLKKELVRRHIHCSAECIQKVTKKLKKGLDKCDEILYSNQRTDLKVNFKEIESKFLRSQFGEIPKLAEGAPLERE